MSSTHLIFPSKSKEMLKIICVCIISSTQKNSDWYAAGDVSCTPWAVLLFGFIFLLHQRAKSLTIVQGVICHTNTRVHNHRVYAVVTSLYVYILTTKCDWKQQNESIRHSGKCRLKTEPYRRHKNRLHGRTVVLDFTSLYRCT